MRGVCCAQTRLPTEALYSQGVVKRIRNLKDRFSGLCSYGNYEDLLRDPNVDVVYIPIPTALRLPWIVKAIEQVWFWFVSIDGISYFV